MIYINVTHSIPFDGLLGISLLTSIVQRQPRSSFSFFGDMICKSTVVERYQDKCTKWHCHALPVVKIGLWNKIAGIDSCRPHVRVHAQCHPLKLQYEFAIDVRADYMRSDLGADLRKAVVLTKLGLEPPSRFMRLAQ